ncbi:MAG: hypothetical protein WDN48_07325 [Pseudolabrys sp.]
MVDADGKPSGVLGRDELIRAIKTLGPDARVADAMNANFRPSAIAVAWTKPSSC